MCVWQWKNNNFKLNYFLKLIGIGLGKTRQYLVLFWLKKRTLVLFILKKRTFQVCLQFIYLNFCFIKNTISTQKRLVPLSFLFQLTSFVSIQLVISINKTKQIPENTHSIVILTPNYKFYNYWIDSWSFLILTQLLIMYVIWFQTLD